MSDAQLAISMLIASLLIGVVIGVIKSALDI